MTAIRVGLVLSGGGAKGAYQVGVVKALVESGTQVHAIAGASIGALNGAILASAASLEEGAERMEQVWLALAASSPISLRMPGYLSLLYTAGLRLNSLDLIGRIASVISPTWRRRLPEDVLKWLHAVQTFDASLLSQAPLHNLMDQYLDVNAMSKGLPLYISVFRSGGAFHDVLACVAGEVGLADSPASEFLHVQSLAEREQREALLASAAIPLLFAPRHVNHALYSDGGQGGWATMQGNTPITPLLEAGYRMVIVTHLSDGSPWRRHNFSDATVLEIRPRSPIKREGMLNDLMGFDSRKVASWIKQGYEDTLGCLESVLKAGTARIELRTSESALASSQQSFNELDKNLVEAMGRLR